MLECLRAGEERKKEKLETRDRDRVRDSKKEDAKKRERESTRGDRKAVRTMDKEGTRLEKRRLMH